ncbi:MAG: CPBP family intramembrane metalloprotease [Planctomycetota bacterium]|nr:MAG: CPBP family intramembrane metalloprotease [Planctomycetota bacterium]
MKWPLVRHVFIKDGRELLRDRRTLFVNVGLPVLLYPILALLFIQIGQLAIDRPEDWTRIAVIDGDEQLLEQLPVIDEQDLPDAASKDDRPSHPLILRAIDASQQERIRRIAGDMQGLQQQLEDLPERDQRDADEVDQAHDWRAAIRRLRQEAATELRQAGVAMAIVGEDGEEKQRYHLLLDDAHPRFDRSWPVLSQSLDDLQQERVRQRLRDADLDPESILSPHDTHQQRLAATAENVRVRLAGVIPIILVMLALSGAFMPAIDLIAGERERGTLETLLSLPGGREEIFAGKLLVVATAAVINVVLNLISLGLTVTIVGTAMMPGGMDDGMGMAIDIPSLLLAFTVLLPLCLTLAALSLGLAGLAASTKEAQNYLGPLFLVVMVPTFAAMMPNIGPGPLVDLLPILGPVLVLKETLQSPGIPWMHVAITTLSSCLVAWVVVGWAARLLEQERFLFPGTGRCGWGIWRRWGPRPAVPDAMESLGLFAACLGSFIVVSMLAGPLLGPGLGTIAAQVLGLLAPALIHCFLGGYNPRQTLFWQAPRPGTWPVVALLTPLTIILSLSLGQAQAPLIPEESLESLEQMQQVLDNLIAMGGIPLLLFTVAIVPGICEEVLCRGTLLSGLRKGIGIAGAIVVSALIFGLMHLSPYRFLSQAILGIVLAILVLRCGSLWPAIIIHALHNGCIVLLALAAEQALGSEGSEVMMQVEPLYAWIWLALGGFTFGACLLLLSRLHSRVTQSSPPGPPTS